MPPVTPPKEPLVSEFNPANAALPGKPDDNTLKEVQRIKAELSGPSDGGAEAVEPTRPLLVVEGIQGSTTRRDWTSSAI